MDSKLIFNHIPKTGGTTLRIILNRVYGIENIYFIESKNIGRSLTDFSSLNPKEKNKYKVISGHGANLFTKYSSNPIKITLLREPISLFLSQYYYLKSSPNSNFLTDVKSLKSEMDYIEFALKMGQDNLLTRYLSDEIDWLANDKLPIPCMEKQGGMMVEKAKANLHNYNFISSLENFDHAVFHLSELLNWDRIPLYRPTNITKSKQVNNGNLTELKILLKNVLRWDIELYNYFLDNKIDSTYNLQKKSVKYYIFITKQYCINNISRVLNQNKSRY